MKEEGCATVCENVPHGWEGAGVTSPRAHAALDVVEALMRQSGLEIDLEPVHLFTPGLYVRELTMPAGARVVSKVHRTEHPYVVTKGRAMVWIDGKGWELIVAPHKGITRPGTRRLLYILEECTWTTYHATELTYLEAIEAAIIEPRDPALTAAEIALALEELKR